MILTILFSHILVGVMLFFCFLALIYAFKNKKQADKDKTEYRDNFFKHQEEMQKTMAEQDEFGMYDRKKFS